MIDRLLRRAVTGYLLAVVSTVLIAVAMDRTSTNEASAAPTVVSPTTVEINTPIQIKTRPIRRLDDRYNRKLKLTTAWQTDDPVCKLPPLKSPTTAEQAKADYEQAYMRALLWPSDHNIKHFRHYLKTMDLCDASGEKCYVDGTVLMDYFTTMTHFANMQFEEKFDRKERRQGLCEMITSDEIVLLGTVQRQRTAPYDECLILYDDVDRYRNTSTDVITEYAYQVDSARKTEGVCGEIEQVTLFMTYYENVRYAEEERTLRYWLDINSFTDPSDASYPACSAEELDFVRQALDTATTDWEDACETCDIDYHRTDVDLSEPVLVPVEQFVTFVVTSEVPTAGEVAKAFFPSETYDGPVDRYQQTMELNPHYYCTTNEAKPGYIPIPVADDWTPDISLTGILRHEFGHTLGYGHEFMADIGTFQQTYGCSQDGDQDPQMAKLMDAVASEPDRSSVMMYPCGRIERTMEERPDTIEFELSETDKLSHQCFYTAEDPDKNCRDLGEEEDE